MDLEFLDKKSKVTPLLVRLYDSQKIHKLAKSEQPQAREELTAAVCELLEMGLSHNESELIADVLIGLTRQAEMDFRQALSEKLSAYDTVPLRLVLLLANDEIEVARPILTNSPVLGDADLIYIIKAKGPEYWRAIAARKKMGDEVIGLLAECRNLDAALTLVENHDIKLTPRALVALSDMVQTSEPLAMPFLQREEVDSELAKKLYEHVSIEVKAFIEVEYNVNAEIIIDAVDDILEEVDHSNFMPTQSMLTAALRHRDKGLLTVKMILGGLRRGAIQNFIAQFSLFTAIEPANIISLLEQEKGRGLATVCKAHNVPKEDFVSIFLLTNAVRRKGEMVDMGNMTVAMEYYDKITAQSAREVLNIIEF